MPALPIAHTIVNQHNYSRKKKCNHGINQQVSVLPFFIGRESANQTIKKQKHEESKNVIQNPFSIHNSKTYQSFYFLFFQWRIALSIRAIIPVKNSAATELTNRLLSIPLSEGDNRHTRIIAAKITKKMTR